MAWVETPIAAINLDCALKTRKRKALGTQAIRQTWTAPAALINQGGGGLQQLGDGPISLIEQQALLHGLIEDSAMQ